jgi:hypothetical protein
MSSTIEKTALAMMGTAATVAIYSKSMDVVSKSIGNATKQTHHHHKRRR